MANQKTSSENPEAQSPTDADGSESPFAKLPTPARRRQPRQKAKRSTRVATPPASDGDVDPETPPESPTSETKPAEEAAAPTLAADRAAPPFGCGGSRCTRRRRSQDRASTRCPILWRTRTCKP